MRRQYALDEAGELKFAQALVTWQYDEIERLQSVASSEMKLREGNFAEIERLQVLRVAVADWFNVTPGWYQRQEAMVDNMRKALAACSPDNSGVRHVSSTGRAVVRLEGRARTHLR
jgi:hypothetical protein